MGRPATAGRGVATAAPSPVPAVAPLVWPGVALLLGLIVATAYTRFHATATLTAVTLLLVVLAWRRTLLAWPTLLGLVLVTILFVPVRRYTIAGGLPFALEPYRLVAGAVLAAWAAALLVDPTVRLRRTGFERPILLLVAAIVLSLAFNVARAAPLLGTVVKGVALFASFLLVAYLVAGVVTERRVLDRLVALLVLGGVVLAASAVVEWRTGYNAFDHLERAVPLLDYREAGSVTTPERGDRPRAYASAQHSIALGAALVLLLPLAVYLYRRTRSFGWMVAAAALTLGALASGSRTAVVMLAAALLAFLWLQRDAVVRLLPLLLPLLVVVQIAMPGSLGTYRAVFFPEQGLVAEAEGSAGEVGSGRLADLGPSLEEWGRRPLFGQGFGTRLTALSDERVNALILDNQWLASLLELGAVGFVALAWLLGGAVRRLGRRARGDDSADGWLLTALCAAIVAYAVGMLTYDAFSFTQVTVLAFVILGLTAPALRLARDGVERPA